MKPRALVTGAGGPAGRAIAAQLKARGIPVLGTDVRELPAGAGLTAVPVPPASDPELVSALRRLVVLDGINLVIPTVSEELPQLAAFRAAFGAEVRVIIGDPGPVAVANDKLFTAWQLQSAGVPVPRFGVPGDFADAEAAMAALGGPVVVKPRVSRGGRGVIVIDGSTDVDWHHLPDGQIVQEFIPGTEYGPMVFGTPAHNSAAPFVVVVEKTELAHGNVGNAVDHPPGRSGRGDRRRQRGDGRGPLAGPHRPGGRGRPPPRGRDPRGPGGERPVRREQRTGPGTARRRAGVLRPSVLQPGVLPARHRGVRQCPGLNSTFAAALPGAQLLLLVLGVPILVFGLVKLLVLPLSAWFEIRAAGRRRREAPTLHDEWPSVSIIVPGLQRGNRDRELCPVDPAHPV